MSDLHEVGERVIGPCEFTDEDGDTLRLSLFAEYWRTEIKHHHNGWLYDKPLTHHEALCLRRCQVDDWLAERQFVVVPGWKDGKLDCWGLAHRDDAWPKDEPPLLFADKDAARVAALEAIEKEKA